MAKKTEAKRSYKLDIMTVLEAADKGMKDFYTNLTEEEQKAFAPRVIMRWMSTLSDKNDLRYYQILATNDLVNLGMWSLGRHPELLWQLMCVSGTGRKQYHGWIPMVKKETTTPKWDDFIDQVWPHTNTQERQILKNIKTTAEWLELIKQSGADDKQIKEIRSEIQKFQKLEGD
jgi:hypothetical protein